MRKAVIFDLDGVITDTAKYHYFAWKKMADEIGIHIDEEFNETLKGVDRMGSLERILALGTKKYLPEEKEVLADRKNEYYKELIKNMNATDLLPGAKSTLENLREMGIKVALASASKNAPAIVGNLGIAHLFDYIVDAGKIKKGKPDPEIYLTAAENLQIPSHECIGVEDAIVGVESIKGAQMYAVGVGNPNVLREADEVIPDLTAFPVGDAYKAIK